MGSRGDEVLKSKEARRGEEGNEEVMARGSEKPVSAQTQPGISSRCPGDNFNNSRGAACPSAATAGPAAGMPASQPGWGGSCSRQSRAQAHAGQPAGQKPQDQQCTMPGHRRAAAHPGHATRRQPKFLGRAPWRWLTPSFLLFIFT